LLYNCVINTLKKANELKCKSVSLPAISSGIFGFPKPLCAQVMFNAVEAFVKDHSDQKDKMTLKIVRFTNFDTETTTIFEQEFSKRYGKSTSGEKSDKIDVEKK
jgi:O-acetyl-ADP-ribose deacetylase (regulator of RNase III)